MLFFGIFSLFVCLLFLVLMLYFMSVVIGVLIDGDEV